ncbi:MAG: IS1-like element transposase [Candidatus Binataceae bacterium]
MGPTINLLPIDKQVQGISALTEGCSISSTERLTNVNRNTIMSLSLRIGGGCERLHDGMMRDLQVNQIELDEQWDFIQKKQKRVQTGDPAEFGDVWLFVALAATQKAVLSYLVGKRSTANTHALRAICAPVSWIVRRSRQTGMRHTSARLKLRSVGTWITRCSRKSTSAIPIFPMRRIATRPVTSRASKRP